MAQSVSLSAIPLSAPQPPTPRPSTTPAVSSTPSLTATPAPTASRTSATPGTPATPATPAENGTAGASEPPAPITSNVPTATAPKAASKGKARIVFPVLILVAAAAGVGSYVHGLGKESTDDAQVEGHVASVSSRIGGQVTQVLVKDNQLVHAGDVVVELDNRDAVAKLAAAKADLAAARAQLRASEAQVALTRTSIASNLLAAQGGLAQASAVQGTTSAAIDQAAADVTAAKSRRDLAMTELNRSQILFTSGSSSESELDTRRSSREQADAALAQAEARLASAKANVSNVSGTFAVARGKMVAAQSGPEQIEAVEAQTELARARVAQIEASVAQAQLALDYTKVLADVSGTVSRRTVEPGQLVSPDRPLFAIVPLEDTWVVANFKEDQLHQMHAGQRVDVTVDTFDGESFHGTVDSLAAGTGARFSLLPPDNASGNFTKVVQRVPVLVHLDPHPNVQLRPGMSAAVTVHVK